MARDRPANLDLLALAEEVTADRRTLSNVIDQIAVAEPDDEARRDAVAELQSLVMTLTAIRGHAVATAESRLEASMGSAGATHPVASATSRRRRTRPWPSVRPESSRLIVGAGAILLAIAIFSAIANGLR